MNYALVKKDIVYGFWRNGSGHNQKYDSSKIEGLRNNLYGYRDCDVYRMFDTKSKHVMRSRDII